MKKNALVTHRYEVVVERDGKCSPQTKREHKPKETDRCRPARIISHRTRVDLESDQEQEEHQPHIGREGEDGDALGREDAIREVRDVAHDRRAEEDAADDLRDNPRLAEALKEDGEELGEADDNADLDDPEAERVRGIVRGRILARDDTGLVSKT